MIQIKTKKEIGEMEKACRLAARILEHVEKYLKPGISTEEINQICEDFTRSRGAISAPLGYKGFPKSVCTSVNNIVCHGIPTSKRILKNGDIINIDVTPILNGWHGDKSKTYVIGEASESTMRLVAASEKALIKGIESVKPKRRFNVIGSEIENFVMRHGYSVVRALGGHGIGRKFHEDPFVYHYALKKKLPRFKAGMVFTVEPMINGGKYDVDFDQDDHWTVRTRDGALSAQFEHTVVVTEKGVEILTL